MMIQRIKKILVTDLHMTCSACPSQWEGLTENGDWFYARYRWGVLSVYIDEQMIFNKDFDDPYHGVMSSREMIKHTQHLFDYEAR